MNVLELKGDNCLLALNGFSRLMLGLKMIPTYQHFSFEEFMSMIDAMDPDGQRSMVRQAVRCVDIDRELLYAIVSFVKDPNGVRYGSQNFKSLTLLEQHDIVVEVCVAVAAAMKTPLVTDAEKKN